MIGIPIPYPLDVDVDETPTWPPAGSAALLIADEKEELFFSASWTVRARVNGEVLWESKPRDTAHGRAFIAQWSRFVIRRGAKRLRELGVDVKLEYVTRGGKEDDLDL